MITVIEGQAGMPFAVGKKKEKRNCANDGSQETYLFVQNTRYVFFKRKIGGKEGDQEERSCQNVKKKSAGPSTRRYGVQLLPAYARAQQFPKVPGTTDTCGLHFGDPFC